MFYHFISSKEKALGKTVKRLIKQNAWHMKGHLVNKRLINILHLATENTHTVYCRYTPTGEKENTANYAT